MFRVAARPARGNCARTTPGSPSAVVCLTPSWRRARRLRALSTSRPTTSGIRPFRERGSTIRTVLHDESARLGPLGDYTPELLPRPGLAPDHVGGERHRVELSVLAAARRMPTTSGMSTSFGLQSASALGPEPVK